MKVQAAPRPSITTRDDPQYQDAAYEPLESVDPTRTLLARLCNRVDDVEFNVRIIRTTRRLVPAMHVPMVVYVISLFLSFVVVDTKWRSIVSWTVGISGWMEFLFILASLSWDVLRLLVRTFEFWFLFVVNACNVALWSIILADDRAIGVVAGGTCYGISLCMDANIYTRDLKAREMVVGSSELVVMLTLGALHRLPEAQYPTYHLFGLAIDSVDLLATGNMVIIFFTALRVLRARSWIWSNRPIDRIQCDMYFPLWGLVPRRQNSPSEHTVMTFLRTSRRQPLQFVAEESTHTISSHSILAPSVANRFRRWWLGPIVNCVGLLGLSFFSAAVYLTMIHSPTRFATPLPNTLLLPSVGLLATLLFVLANASHYQKALLKRIVVEIDAWFVLVQIFVITIGTCDVLAWRVPQTLLASTAWLWCLWILCTDALVPIARRRLRFSRPFALLVIAVMAVYLLLLGYWLYYSPARALLRNRVLLYSEFRGGGSLQVDVLGTVSSKLFMLWIWMGRFFWRELFRPAGAFKLIKHRVYYRISS